MDVKAQSHAQTDVGGSVLIEVVDAASIVEVAAYARLYIRAKAVAKQVFYPDTAIDGVLRTMFGERAR